jgi:hypothetical protein
MNMTHHFRRNRMDNVIQVLALDINPSRTVLLTLSIVTVTGRYVALPLHFVGYRLSSNSCLRIWSGLWRVRKLQMVPRWKCGSPIRNINRLSQMVWHLEISCQGNTTFAWDLPIIAGVSVFRRMSWKNRDTNELWRIPEKRRRNQVERHIA